MASQVSGDIRSKSCLVGTCHDQRRLVASSSRAERDSGRTVRTVNLRMAFTIIQPRRNLWVLRKPRGDLEPGVLHSSIATISLWRGAKPSYRADGLENLEISRVHLPCTRAFFIAVIFLPSDVEIPSVMMRSEDAIPMAANP